MKIYLRYAFQACLLANIVIAASLYAHAPSKSAQIGTKDVMGYCGDGIINGNEQCDGDSVSISSCRVLGGGDGFVRCQPNCIFDISGCLSSDYVYPPIRTIVGGTPRLVREGFCGDGIINGPNEDCDQGAIQNTSCADYNAGVGTVKCQRNCLYDMSDCSR
ncbi:MAG TPA: hypothetical protein VEL47_05210 [Myxococcota bacterium]|nr:hypothetical protein [Myxococcota bacterium]